MKKVNEMTAAKSRRIRHSPEQWQAIVAAQVARGQNVSAYCRASGLCAVTLAKWRKRLAGELGTPMAANAAPPRQANYAKVLYWSRGGYCLWANQWLERGHFAKTSSAGIAVPMTDTQLMMWLDGVEMRSTVQRKRVSLPEGRGSAAIMAARIQHHRRGVRAGHDGDGRTGAPGRRTHHRRDHDRRTRGAAHDGAHARPGSGTAQRGRRAGDGQCGLTAVCPRRTSTRCRVAGFARSVAAPGGSGLIALAGGWFKESARAAGRWLPPGCGCAHPASC